MYARIDVITTDRWQIYWINQRLSGVVIDTQSNLRPHTLNTHTLWAESNHSVMYISSSVSPFNINASPQWDCTPAPIAANCPTHPPGPITINHPPPTLHLHTPPPVPSFSHLPVWPWLSLSASCVFWTEEPTDVLSVLRHLLMFVFTFGWDSSEVCVITFWFD